MTSTRTATAPSNLRYDAISSYAERVGTHYEIYDDDGSADIMAFIHRLGGDIVYADSIESLDVNARGDFTVTIPRTTSPRRDQFTAAHELGHYFLHYVLPKEEKPMAFWRGGRNRAETEANVFAAALLMPESRFRAAHGAGNDAQELARMFNVSPAAAEVRMQVLKLS